MKREDYMFCIGYQGDTALVDGQARKTYGKASIEELVGKGLYRFALSGALFDNDQDSLKLIRERYNTIAGTTLMTTEDLKQMFGVIEPSDAITRVMLVR